MNFDLDAIVTAVLVLCGALFLVTVAILVYALLIVLELHQRLKALREHSRVIREWPLKNGRRR
jgi:hypothetical protein